MNGAGADRAEILRQAVARYEAADYVGAARLFASLAQSGADAAATRLWGLSLVRAGDAASGLPHLEAALAMAPDDGLARLHYGIGLQAARRCREAADAFRAARALLPDNPAPPLNLSAALMELGDVAGAREAAAAAVALAPQSAEAHYALGLSETAAGAPEAAMRAFGAALRLNRNLADAWVNLGVLEYQCGNVERAAYAMSQALRTRPRHLAAMTNLAAFENLRGDFASAERRLREALAVDPGNGPARLNLASLLLNDREPQEALALLDGAPPPGLPGAHWRAQRAGALLTLGRADEAKAELDAIAEPLGASEILVLWRRLVLAFRAGDIAESDRLAGRMAVVAQDERGALLEHRIIGHFEIARYANGRGDKEVAFDHWERAHRLLARTQPFSRQRHQAFIDATLQAYRAGSPHWAPTSGRDDPAPVFVVGLPRSGTTLVEQILSAHPAVHGAGERPALFDALTRLGAPALSAESVRRTAALSGEALGAMADGYLRELHAVSPASRYVVDKMPSNALHLGFAAKLLPGCRVIACERDPRDIGLSIFQFRFFGYHPYAHDLGDLGWYIGQHARLMQHWRAILPVPVLTVRLEDWVVDFRGALEKALAFLDLPYHENCETFYLSDRKVRTASQEQVRRPVNAQGLGRWVEYAGRLQPLIEELELSDASRLPLQRFAEGAEEAATR